MIFGMSAYGIVIFLLVASVFVCEGLDPSACQTTPKEKHCLIEYSVRDRWPHTVRYVYNWSTKTCFEIRWANHCPPVPDPPTSNNFASEKECNDQCGGWA